MRYSYWRRALCALVAMWAGGVWLSSRAQAEIAEAVRDAGEHFFGFAESFGEGHHRLRINGLHFDVRSRTLAVPPEDVLDALEQRCRLQDGGWSSRVVRALGRVAGSAAPTFRVDGGTVGMVACLALGEQDVSVAALVVRLQQMVEDGDLSHVGEIRLARVEPAGAGSHVVTLASRGPLRLLSALANRSDAPGEDPRWMVERPPGVRRVLSASAEQHAPSITVYRGPRMLDADAWLRRWRVRGWDLRSADVGEAHRRWVATRGEDLAVVAVRHTQERTWISVLGATR